MNAARLSDMSRSIVYRATAKGRIVLRSAALWGLSRHLRELLEMCDPHVRLDHARQSMPPESLRIALYALQQLELIDGPPVDAPNLASTWAEDLPVDRKRSLRHPQPTSAPA